MRHLFQIAFLAALLLASPIMPAAPQAAGAPEQSLLWKIERPGRPVSWLFGTHHSTSAKIALLPVQVTTAIRHVKLVVTEMKFDPAEIQQTMARTMFVEEARLPALLGDDYPRLQTALAQRGMPPELALQLKPWVALMFLLRAPETEPMLPLDLQIAQRAEHAGIATAGLETMQEQLAVLSDIDEARVARLILDLLDHAAEYAQLSEQLDAAYLQGDLQAIERIGRQANPHYTPDDLVWEKQFQYRMLEERNVRMVERLTPLMERGAVLVAVGAGHLPGPTGLIARLRKQGYRLTPVRIDRTK